MSRIPVLTLLSLMLVLAVIWSLASGAFYIAPASLWQHLVAWMQGAPIEDATTTVLTNIRLPRLVLAIAVGAVLAASGASYQGMFKNPLVSPDILGVSSGAGLGASLAILWHLPYGLIQLMAFVGGMLAVTLVMLVGLKAKHYDRVLVLVLAGIAVGSLLGAGISLVKLLADPYTDLPSITFWLMGSLAGVSSGDLGWSLTLMGLGLIPLWLLRWRLNTLSLHDDEAKALGVPVERTRWILIVSATLATAASVSMTGIIGWVGLVIPHIARFMVGPNYLRLLPASMLVGSLFLVVTDTLARTVAPLEIPLGLLTSLLGAPFFLYLLLKRSAA